MAEHDFSALYAHYPDIIAQMPEIFTSHQFILELARQHQLPYIEALYSYRHKLRDGKPAPFMIVHGILAQHLHRTDLIEQIHKVAPSVNIWGQDDTCATWRKRA